MPRFHKNREYFAKADRTVKGAARDLQPVHFADTPREVLKLIRQA